MAWETKVFSRWFRYNTPFDIISMLAESDSLGIKNKIKSFKNPFFEGLENLQKIIGLEGYKIKILQNPSGLKVEKDINLQNNS